MWLAFSPTPFLIKLSGLKHCLVCDILFIIDIDYSNYQFLSRHLIGRSSSQFSIDLMKKK